MDRIIDHLRLTFVADKPSLSHVFEQVAFTAAKESVDRHPIHRAGAVKKWLGTKGRRVRLFYLPGYRPDLNPGEYLNQEVKSNAVGSR